MQTVFFDYPEIALIEVFASILGSIFCGVIVGVFVSVDRKTLKNAPVLPAWAGVLLGLLASVLVLGVMKPAGVPFYKLRADQHQILMRLSWPCGVRSFSREQVKTLEGRFDGRYGRLVVVLKDGKVFESVRKSQQDIERALERFHKIQRAPSKHRDHPAP